MDRAEQVGRNVLPTPFDLGQVLERDRSCLGDIGERPSLTVSLLSQDLTDEVPQARVSTLIGERDDLGPPSPARSVFAGHAATVAETHPASRREQVIARAAVQAGDGHE